MYLHFIIVILIYFQLIMPAVNYVICGYSSLRTTPGLITIHSTGASDWKKSTVAVITQDRVIDDNLKSQIKNQTLYACRLFLLTRIVQYISNWSKVFGHLPTLFLQYT